MRRMVVFALAMVLVVGVCGAADSLNVSLAGHYYTGGHSLGVYVSGIYAYVANAYGGLRIIDISTPSSPSEVGFFNTEDEANDVYVSGNYVYVTDIDGYLYIIDTSTPSAPSEVGRFDTVGWGFSVCVSDDYAYVVYGYYGLRIIDISTPTAPFEAGFFDTGGYAYGVYISSDFAYVADGVNGLRIIDVFDPTSPSEVGFYDTGGLARSIYVLGDYAYMTDGYDGFRIIDVSDPTSPTEVGFYETGGYARGIYVLGDHAYVAVCGDGDGLYILDISYFTGIEECNASKPEDIAISAYPNPFNSAVTISVNCHSGEGRNPEGGVEVEIFDIAGRIVYEMPVGNGAPVPSSNGRGNRAPTEIVWQPDDNIGSGVYLVRAKIGDRHAPEAIITKRVVYLK